MSSQASSFSSANSAPPLSESADFAVGQIIEGTVEDLSRGGSGVLRSNGRVVFVPFTAPGDQLRVRILSLQKRWAEGEVVEILSPSSNRIAPRCPLFGLCGGCQWQHLPYSLQWQTKISGARHALERVGVSPAHSEWREYPAQQIWEYRNRIQLRGAGQEIGFYEGGSRRRVAIERCDIARPELNSVLADVRARGAEQSLKSAGEYKVEIEVMPDGQVRESWNARHAAGGFRQVHDEQNECLKAAVKDLLSGESGFDSRDALLDLYGGAGNLSLGLASDFASIDCVDTGSPARAPVGTPPNFRFHRSPVLPWIKRLKSSPISEGGVLRVILDPPRTGFGEDAADLVDGLRRLDARVIVAVGCDADSWARDVARLVRGGWSLDRAGALDLFPQTPHVEALARLVRVN